jgi:hypothetical protein
MKREERKDDGHCAIGSCMRIREKDVGKKLRPVVPAAFFKRRSVEDP